MLCNTAIFYDIENLLGIFSGKTKTVLNLDEIYRRVLETEGVHGVSIQKAYADWALIPNRALRDSVLQVGIEPIQIFNTNQNDRVKNAADVSLIIDVVELITKRPEIENYVIASGDGIFAFLSKKLHEYGKRVIGCGFDRNASNTFRYSCDYYISLEKSDKSLVATTSSRKKNRVNEIVPLVEIPQPIKVPDKFPKTKYSEILASADIPIWRDINDSSGCLHTVRKLIEALFVEETEGLPNLEISVFKNYVTHYIPDFKVTKFSFTRFAEFMRFMLTGSAYCLYTVDESVYKITRRNAEIKNGIMLEDTQGVLVTAEDGSRYGSVFGLPPDMPFIFTITPESPVAGKKRKLAPETPRRTKRNKTEQPPKNGRRRKDIPKPDKTVSAPIPVTQAEPMQSVEPQVSEVEIVMDEGSFRKWIKGRFQALSDMDAISANEASQMMTSEYSRSTFGIKTPILREIESRSNLLEQRSINGKVKYWKETFMFNGRHYLVYKDWVANLHKDRYIKWLRGMGSAVL
ncbi:MAG: NYN domain-containing protein [Defluviitaleaceae bacterium]|nr:NYN domain-containing protein [Defluviitaleaceae bacterium]